MVAGYFLLLAQKKVTKENGTLGAAPSPMARVRYGRTGSAGRPSMASRPNRRDPSRARVQSTRLVHPPFAAALEGTRRAKALGPAFAGTTKLFFCFCGRDCRALL